MVIVHYPNHLLALNTMHREVGDQFSIQLFNLKENLVTIRVEYRLCNVYGSKELKTLTSSKKGIFSF